MKNKPWHSQGFPYWFNPAPSGVVIVFSPRNLLRGVSFLRRHQIHKKMSLRGLSFRPKQSQILSFRPKADVGRNPLRCHFERSAAESRNLANNGKQPPRIHSPVPASLRQGFTHSPIYSIHFPFFHFDICIYLCYLCAYKALISDFCILNSLFDIRYSFFPFFFPFSILLCYSLPIMA